jgi:hypothetical protein
MDLNQSGINKKKLRGTKEGKECGVDGIEGEEEVCVRRRKEKHSDSLTGKVPLDG